MDNDIDTIENAFRTQRSRIFAGKSYLYIDITIVEIKKSNNNDKEVEFSNEEKQMIIDHLHKFNIPYQLTDFKCINSKTMDKLQNFWEKDVSVGLKLRFWFIAQQLLVRPADKNLIEKIAIDSNIFTKGNIYKNI